MDHDAVKLGLVNFQWYGRFRGRGVDSEGNETNAPYPSRNPKGGTRAILERDATCKVPVELVKIEGGGHNIPGPGRNIAPASGPHNADVDAARLIFEFFARLKGA